VSREPFSHRSVSERNGGALSERNGGALSERNGGALSERNGAALRSTMVYMQTIPKVLVL